MNVDKDTLKAWRLVSQDLVNRRWSNPGQVVEGLGGVQAQDYRWAKWSLGLRLHGWDDQGVERVLQERQIVRTWMFRGTLHFVATSDLSWLNALLAPGIIRGNTRRYRQLGLDNGIFLRSQKVLQSLLHVHGSLTRSEIRLQLEAGGVSAVGQRLPYLLQRAALDGLVCHGPHRGNEPTFVLLADCIGAQSSLDREEALGVLASRYFASHGPATQQDFAWWSGLTAGEARQALGSALDLVPFELDGVQYWVSGDFPVASVSRGAYLLPPFDEYLLGYKERSLVLDPVFAKKVNAGGGMPKPTVMMNGDIVGVWSYKLKQQEMLITIYPFRMLESHELDSLALAAHEFSSFVSLPVDISISTDNVA